MRVLSLVTALLLLAGCAGCSSGAKSGAAQPSFAGSGFAACPAAVGKPPGSSPLADLPTLSCMDSSGSKVALGAPTGRPMVVNLWGSWCPPCGKELPAFVALSATAGDRLTVLGVDTGDGATNAVAAAREADVKFANVYDRDERVRKALKVTALPATAFVTGGGEVAYVYQGTPLTEAALAGLVRQHLGVVVK